MVASRCVAIKVVRPRINSLMVSMMAASVLGSSAEVGSSSNKNWRVLQKCTRNSDALALTDTQVTAAFADEVVVSLRHLLNELVRLRPSRSFNNRFLSRIGSAIGDVLANGGGEK